MKIVEAVFKAVMCVAGGVAMHFLNQKIRGSKEVEIAIRVRPFSHEERELIDIFTQNHIKGVHCQLGAIFGWDYNRYVFKIPMSKLKYFDGFVYEF